MLARILAVALFVLLIAAAPAAAVDIPVAATCADLQSKMDTAEADPVVTNHHVITLSGICTTNYDLPDFPTPVMSESYRFFTLKGDPSNGTDGFDGTGVTGRVLTGTDVHRVLIQDLTFRDSSVTGAGQSGGAVELTGESGLQLFNCNFFNNHANNRGGAVHLTQEPAVVGATLPVISALGNVFGSTTNAGEGNSATIGGALSVETPGQGQNSGFTSNLFANNTAAWDGGAFDFELASAGSENFSLNDNDVIDNTAGGSGAGGHLIVDNTALRIDNELYQGNSIETLTGAPQGDHFGGGLYVRGNGGPVILRHNVFRSNVVNAVTAGNNYGGGGLAVIGAGLNVESEFTRIESNTVAGQPDGDFDSEGGGIFFSSVGGSWYGFLDAVAGNSVGALGEGGGIYVGAVTATTLELGEVTVAGNSVGAGGQFAGIAGDPDDDLIMRNSIVYNGPQPDIGGFDFFDVRYSDACNGGVPFSGPGNICADPKLVGGDNIHQTTQSPTIDKGGDEFFASEGGGERAETDFEGDARPTDGDGDGHTIDMGADETPADFSKPAPVIPSQNPPPQCSDGVDNDGDGAIDLADPGCLAGPTDNNEGDESLQDVFLCGQRKISLVRADVRDSRVVLSGIVATSVAGQPVQLSVRYLGRRGKAQKLATVTPGADGQFQARVKKPSASLFNLARYRAQVGSARSVELKLPQSLASTSLKQVGGMLELRGQVDRTVLGKRNTVVVKRILCGKYSTVGQARPNKKGVYVVRFPAPPSQGSALYRAETKVLARPGSKRYVKQFARAIGITF